MKWQEVIKLGKAEVTRRLDDLGIVYNHIKHYFKLCSLLYNTMKNQVKEFVQNRVVSLLDRRNAKEPSEAQRLLNEMQHSEMRTVNVLNKIDNLLLEADELDKKYADLLD